IVRHCANIYDLTGADSFNVQGLVQWRDALHAESRTGPIPPGTTQLRLFWSADPQADRRVAINHAAPSAFAYGYGFQPQLEVLNLPARGHFLPGEAVNIRVAF